MVAAHAQARPEVVSSPVAVATEPTQIRLSFDGEATEIEVLAKQPARPPWAWLLSRVFAVNSMTFPRYRGVMRLLEIANKSEDIARVLVDLGLGPRPFPRPRPASTGQLELDFAA